MNTPEPSSSYRFSRQRKRILDLLRETGKHYTAERVYRELKPEFPRLSLGTVYRNLNLLVEQGYIQKIEFSNTFDVFEGNTSPHYHLVCSNCGSITDLQMALRQDLNKEARKETRAAIEKHDIRFYGICRKCLEKPSTEI